MPTIKNIYQAPDLELSAIAPAMIIAASSTLDEYDVVTEEW